MLAASASFIGSLAGLETWRARLGITREQALIYASCGAMLVRIVYAYLHARRLAASKVTRKEMGLALLPNWDVFLTGVAGAVGLRVMTQQERGWNEMILVGGMLGMVMLVVMWEAEKGRFAQVRASLGGKKKA